MTSRPLAVSLICLALSSSVACSTGEARLYLPEGDAAAGRVAFEAMQCYACHEVPGETFPPPHATPPVPVPLGPEVVQKPADELAESILAPSHEIPDDLEGVQRDGRSRMGDWSEVMTVREWLDIVAYLTSL
ncbi:MAG: c-type cytochrome [Gemmatimonadota bacterium]